MEDGKISFEDFKKIEIKTAEVLEVVEHPDADKLYLLKIKVGEVVKQIVAGIRSSYQKEELVGKMIVIIDNLQPATIRGEESQGMLLAASGENGPVVLVPDKDVPAGVRVK